MGSPMYPAVEEIMTITPFFSNFLKKWIANLTATISTTMLEMGGSTVKDTLEIDFIEDMFGW